MKPQVPGEAQSTAPTALRRGKWEMENEGEFSAAQIPSKYSELLDHENFCPLCFVMFETGKNSSVAVKLLVLSVAILSSQLPSRGR